jgi:hypothetical protein
VYLFLGNGSMFHTPGNDEDFAGAESDCAVSQLDVQTSLKLGAK